MLKEAGAERDCCTRVKEVQEGLGGGARAGVDSRPVCRWRGDNTLEAVTPRALSTGSPSARGLFDWPPVDLCLLGGGFSQEGLPRDWSLLGSYLSVPLRCCQNDFLPPSFLGVPSTASWQGEMVGSCSTLSGGGAPFFSSLP